MPEYRSRTTTAGRNMAGARALWRATGMKDDDFHKPIIAVANSFTQFVPGHVHLKDMGQLVAREIEKAGGVAKEFNTIAVDDGIAMGHDGMLYSLPSRGINVKLSDEALAARREVMEAKGPEAWKPSIQRDRKVSAASRPMRCWPPRPTRARCVTCPS